MVFSQDRIADHQDLTAVPSSLKGTFLECMKKRSRSSYSETSNYQVSTVSVISPANGTKNQKGVGKNGKV